MPKRDTETSSHDPLFITRQTYVVPPVGSFQIYWNTDKIIEGGGAVGGVGGLKHAFLLPIL